MSTHRSYYNKPALNLDDQVRLVVERGLQSDHKQLEAVLKAMNLYRLSSYLWWFYNEDDKEKTVVPGTSLEDVLRLYIFDAQLRAFIMRLSHAIEVWLRAALSNTLAKEYGPMGYQNEVYYASATAFHKDLSKLDEMLSPGSGKREKFIQDFSAKYCDERPPIWMVVEVMSLGLLSKWYDNIKQDKLRKEIAKQVDVHPRVLSSFLRLFTVLRNASAHHSRVWNRQTSLAIAEIKKQPELLKQPLEGADYGSIYVVLVIAVFIVQKIGLNSDVVGELRDFLSHADNEWLLEMDFPLGFEKDTLWNPGE